MEIIMIRPTTAEENNALLMLGYAWKVRGDWALTDRTDPWSGMPEVESAEHFFTDHAEAEAYAIRQVYPLNHEVRGTVEKVERMETREEREAREAEEKAKREAKRKAREAEAGYKAHRNYKRCETEIRKMREEVARLEKAIREAETKKAHWARQYEEETGKAI